MPELLQLTPDELLSTTRAVRKRLDFSRPVERTVIEECIQLAQQAPTASNRQTWHFVVVTDPEKRRQLGDLYRQGWARYSRNPGATYDDPARVATQSRVRSSAQFLADHFHEAPVHVIPCIEGRTDGQPAIAQAGHFGSILPAVWSFCLAARARGLGTCWTTIHLSHEREAAELLGIPYDRIMQTALITVGYTKGTDFKPGPRADLDSILHWDAW